MKAIKAMLTLLLLVGIVGCGYGPSKEDMQSEIVRQASEQVSHLGIAATECTLVKESKNKYTGFVKFNNGEQQSINVTVDGDEFLWKPE